jgi:hypothetical protein
VVDHPLESSERPDHAVGQMDGSADRGFLPATPPRAGVESIVVRFIATAGVVGIGTAIGATLSTTNVAGWIIGLAVSMISVVLAALLWRSRRL